MNLVRLWHFQVPFCNLGLSCEHFLLAITGVWQVKFFCFYSKSLTKSSVLVFRSWGAGPMTTVCYGWNCITALSLQSVCQLDSCGWALCSWAETTAKCSPFFRTPHLHTKGFVNVLYVRAVIPVYLCKFACAPVGAVYETLWAVLWQVQQVGGLLELFFEFIAVPAAYSECQRVKRLVLRKQGGAQGVHLTQSGT